MTKFPDSCLTQVEWSKFPPISSKFPDNSLTWRKFCVSVTFLSGTCQPFYSIPWHGFSVTPCRKLNKKIHSRTFHNKQISSCETFRENAGIMRSENDPFVSTFSPIIARSRLIKIFRVLTSTGKMRQLLPVREFWKKCQKVRGKSGNFKWVSKKSGKTDS